MKKEVIIIGYSGHAFVVCDIFISLGWKIIGYCEREEKKLNPYSLKYLGNENDIKVITQLKKTFCFVAIGENTVREKVFNHLIKNKITIASAIHPSAIVSAKTRIGSGVIIAPNVVINSMSVIEDGAICNTSSVTEHECVIGKFSHISPGTVLCGNVKIGERTLVGAGAIVKPAIVIGKNCVVGAGAVVLKNIPNNKKMVGNPAREI